MLRNIPLSLRLPSTVPVEQLGVEETEKRRQASFSVGSILNRDYSLFPDKDGCPLFSINHCTGLGGSFSFKYLVRSS